MGIKDAKRIARKYRTLKKLSYNNELLTYFLLYRKENRTHFCLVRQHDFLTMFGNTNYGLDMMVGSKEKMRELLAPAMRNYEKILDDEIKTIENRILERDWGVKV